MKVTANTPIRYNGKRYETDETIDMRKEEVKRLENLVSVVENETENGKKQPDKEEEK